MSERTSRLSGFATLSREKRLGILSDWIDEGEGATGALDRLDALPDDLVDRMIENAIGVMPVPLGLATNMIVDGEDVLIPMATEESSVIAAVCNTARRCRSTGGFRTSYAGSLTIAQIQLLDVADPHRARLEILRRADEIRAFCDDIDPVLVELGGGFQDVDVRLLNGRKGTVMVVHLIVDTRDAMGANAVNTMAERLAPVLADWVGGRSLLRILSNLADRRIVRAEAVWPADEIGGPEVVETMLEAADFAVIDPYRAATHNKGIMNGVSAVVLATGNDTRAIEAGAHAFAAQSGQYSPLTRWEKTANGDLAGSIEIPLSLGIVGGATRIHPVAQLALKIMGADSAEKLSRMVAAVGLAQNFGALRALATDGIQKGHMALHAQNIAITAGATGDEIVRIAEAMKASGDINERTATRLLKELRG
ncbi:3-hydroxy-3-methylglutaryl-coenzyme A reductase [Roseovarius pacificus]|uniref:3-hydroxy-3-methylglutaryl coenzyme A reductase n=1 Tax=Roseovarius pacificus TaxID=337701 RepID=A0A1M7GSY1_9RHOB|nr:hydroxymethylglutaryl-CoA reductase, degradative [Roseovarius pacificus]GGO60258.1 3-hydroxy-3-methylglutaryl-CoA reductase [Roseovarius pacificus]SHM19422.1 3-hydroxy-3-methylglutaryl-coenzyme A reductase [Roseovarius pacificus]